jgi:hypothetical protein
MIFWVRNFAILGMLIAVISCSNTYRNIYTNYDKSIDFSQYNTFAWAPDSGKADNKEPDVMAYDNDIIRNNVKNYITHCLTQRGYLVEVDSPDLVLHLVLLNEKKEKVITYRKYGYMDYYYYSPFYFPYYYPYYRFYTWSYPPFWDETTTYTKTFVKGTITINMYDRKLKKLVWTASGEGDIYDPSYIHFKVHPAIDRMMREFPDKPFRNRWKSDDVMTRNRIVRANSLNHLDGLRNVSSH